MKPGHDIAEKNKRMYLKPPTPEQIRAFIKDELGVSFATYERFFGIAAGTIKNIMQGERDLPARHWHLIFSKVVPIYGVGYNNDQTVLPTRKEQPKDEVREEEKIEEPETGLLNDFRQVMKK